MQTQTEMAPHLATLTRALGDKLGTEVTEEDLRDEFAKYLEYGVPPDQAVKTILRHHGVAQAGGARPPQAAPMGDARVPLADVPPNVPAVNLLVKLLTKNTKTVNARGEDKEILWGLVGDETATLPYTSWRPLEGLEAGDVVEVKGAYTKEWRGEVQVQFGDRCQLEKKDPGELPDMPEQLRELKIAELREGLRGIEVTGRILEVAPREVTVQGEAKTIFGGSIADASGKVEFTCWDDVGLAADTVVKIGGASVRGFRGVPQLNFDAQATIETVEGDFPDAAELEAAAAWPIWRVLEKGDVGDVTVRASLLEVRPGSGLIFRDPETRRVTQPNQAGAEPDLRIKGILDDGTGPLSFVAGRDITERFLGKDLDACLAEAKEAFRYEVIHEQLADKLTGKVFEVRGFSRQDDYGVMLIARDMQDAKVDAEAGAKALLAEFDAEAA